VIEVSSLGECDTTPLLPREVLKFLSMEILAVFAMGAASMRLWLVVAAVALRVMFVAFRLPVLLEDL
jgi:hypothetical protein